MMLTKFVKQNKFYDYDMDDIINYFSKLKNKPKNLKLFNLKPLKFNTKLSWR